MLWIRPPYLQRCLLLIALAALARTTAAHDTALHGPQEASTAAEQRRAARAVMAAPEEPSLPHHTCRSRLGQTPGTFMAGQPPASGFRLLTESHQLQNMLQQYASDTDGSVPLIPVLFIGDSVDWRMMSHACERFLGGGVLPVTEYPQRRQQFTYCQTDKRIKMGTLYIPGVHPTGPWAWQVGEGNGRERLAAAVDDFVALFGAPKVVVLAANFWDLARICAFENEQPECQQAFLSPQFLSEWMRDYKTVYHHLMAALAPHSPLVVYHTQVMPKLKAGGVDGELIIPHIRRSSFVAQLNSAGRQAAMELGLCILDTELMTAGLSEEQRLSDDDHPSHWVWEEMLNLLLNMYEHHNVHHN